VVRTTVFWIVVPGSVFVLGPWLILRASEARWATGVTAQRTAGVGLIAVGSAVLVGCAIDFVLRGWGTPAPYDPTRRLVRGLLYSRVRNPMYVGGTLILLGEALAFRSPALLVYAVVAWVAWHLAVVFVEEPGLRRRFGPEYEAYARRVPRWIPRLRGGGDVEPG